MYSNTRCHRHLLAIQLDRPIYYWHCLLWNWKGPEPLRFRQVRNCKRNTSHDVLTYLRDCIDIITSYILKNIVYASAYTGRLLRTSQIYCNLFTFPLFIIYSSQCFRFVTGMFLLGKLPESHLVS